MLCRLSPLTHLSKMQFLSPVVASASLRSLCAFNPCSRHSSNQTLPVSMRQNKNVLAQQDLDSEAVLYLNSAVFFSHSSFMPMPRIREWAYICVSALIKHIIISVICLPLSPLRVPLKLPESMRWCSWERVGPVCSKMDEDWMMMKVGFCPLLDIVASVNSELSQKDSHWVPATREYSSLESWYVSVLRQTSEQTDQ